MRILIIGLTKELPLSPFDAMDIADKLVARAANAHTNGNDGIYIAGILKEEILCSHISHKF